MSETMKAAIFVEPGKMTVEEVPKAALQQDDDIVIRMVRTCVCASNPCARTAATSPLVRPNTCVCPRRTAPWSRCPVHRKIIPMNSSHRC